MKTPANRHGVPQLDGMPRRNNAGRSAATRQQILDATIRCLHERGYGAVTNIRVAGEAGVSRGAMMHHFPTRLDLLIATVRYAYDKVIAYRHHELSSIAPGIARYRAVIDLGWATARMPEGIAVNEIRVGARSEPEAAGLLRPIMHDISREYAEFINRLIAEAGLKPSTEIDGLANTTALAVRSLSVGRYAPPSQRTIDSVLSTLKDMREAIIERQLGPAARLPVAGAPPAAAPPAGARKPAARNPA